MHRVLLCAAAATFAMANQASAIVILGPTFDVALTEIDGGVGGPSEYIVSNDADSTGTVLGFGVTNPVFSDVGYDNTGVFDGGGAIGGGPLDEGGFPMISGRAGVSPGGQTGAELWTSFVVTDDDWGSRTAAEGYLDREYTFEELFGPWAFGDDFVNWYQVEDANGIAPGEAFGNFLFEATPASDFFGVGNSDLDVTGIFFERDSGPGNGGGTEVPLPAAAWLLLAGVTGLVAARRRGQTV